MACSVSFLALLISLDVGIETLLASHHELGNVLVFILRKSLCSADTISYLSPGRIW